nr:L10-interacting MYB domain-containing protein-like [Tanacetum cinerariifolium]
KEDDMGACIEKLDKVGWAAQDPMYDTVLLLFGQSADYRKLWLHLKPESCGNWVKSVGKIIPMKIDPHSFNAEYDLIESMPNHDSSIIISSKIDSLFYEFVGALTLFKSIPQGIDETGCHPEEETHFTKRLLYDNSSPRPPEEFVSENSNADIESFSLSPIPIKDSDSHMEEIDLSFNPDDSMPPGIEEDDDDSERDIPILEELLDNYSLSLPEIESFHFDIPSSYRPPAKPPDGNT